MKHPQPLPNVKETPVSKLFDLRRMDQIDKFSMRVLNYVAEHPYSTEAEIGKGIMSKAADKIEKSTMKLCRLGYLICAGTRICSIAKRRMRVWNVRLQLGEY